VGLLSESLDHSDYAQADVRGRGRSQKTSNEPHAPRNSSPCEYALLLEPARNALGCLNHDCRRCFRSANKKRWKQEALAFGGVAI
jgi:hypothetical protein